MSYWLGKAALVTGGSAGLGQALVTALAAAGAKVTLAARSADRVRAVADELAAAGYDVTGVAADVTVAADVEALVAGAVQRYGGLDLLINNAGRSDRGQVLETEPERFAELWDLNFLGTVRCSRAAVPHLEKSRGHLVNIGSLASKSVTQFLGAYPASKFAVADYSQQLRYELQPRGVHVLLVCPGPIARPDQGQRYDAQAEALPAAARRPGGGVKLKGIAPQRLAAQVLRACRRRQAELVVPGRARLLFALAQLSPALGDWIVKRMSSSA